MQIVLGSSSPRRLELLRDLGFDPLVVAPEVDETPRPNESTIGLIRRLARDKAEATLRLVDLGAQLPGPTVVVAADTVVSLDGETLGKPTTEDEAVAMLSRLRGRDHEAVTAMSVSLYDGTVEVRSAIEVVAATVTFRAFSPAELDWMLSTGDWRGRAGGYNIQGSAIRFCQHVSGEYSTIVGLPVATLAELLAEWSVG